MLQTLYNFFSWPTFSLSFLKKLTRFPFISPSSLVYFYSNNQQVHLRENEFLRPRSSHYEAVEQPRDGRNKSKEVLLSGVCESITAKFLITRRQETVAADDVRIVVAAHALYYLRFNARNFNNIILSCVQLRVTRIPFRIIAPPPPFLLSFRNFVIRGIQYRSKDRYLEKRFEEGFHLSNYTRLLYSFKYNWNCFLSKLYKL